MRDVCRRIFRTLVVSPVLLLSVGAQQPNYYPQGQGPNYEQQGYDAVDPPSRVARVSQIIGDVSIQPASVSDFSAAEINLPMTSGDRIYSGQGALAEIQTGQLVVRTGQNTDLTVTAMTDTLAQFGLAQGSAHLRSYAVSASGTVEIDTPNVAVSVLEAGDIRVDMDPNTDATIVTVLSGQVEVDGNGLQQVLQGGERARFVGSNPVSAQWLGRPGTDGLDRFSFDRDRVYQSSYASESAYVNPGTIGAEDLNGAGDWSNDAEYGAVWYPRGVAYDWQPYRNGHWAWIAPWGWTWVAAEPWGFAPFHYGRWNRFGNRWGWIPGPVVVRPVYSPALVVFVGGGNTRISAWFPLGPRETYTPWYHASPLYVNRVNVSNIYSRDTVQVRNIYNQRTRNVYVDNGPGGPGGRGYVNRPMATVAMSQDSFASGRRADQNLARVRPQDLQSAPVMQRPVAVPQRGMGQQGPARALPPRMGRPVMESHTEAGGQPGMFRRQGPMPMNTQPAPAARQPQGQPGQPANGQGGYGQGGYGQQNYGGGGQGGRDPQNRDQPARVPFGESTMRRGGTVANGGADAPPAIQSGPAVQQQQPAMPQPPRGQSPAQTGGQQEDGRYRQGNNRPGATTPPSQSNAPSQGGMNIQARSGAPAAPVQAPARPPAEGGMNIQVRPIGPAAPVQAQPQPPVQTQQPRSFERPQPQEQQRPMYTRPAQPEPSPMNNMRPSQPQPQPQQAQPPQREQARPQPQPQQQPQPQREQPRPQPQPQAQPQAQPQRAPAVERADPAARPRPDPR